MSTLCVDLVVRRTRRGAPYLAVGHVTEDGWMPWFPTGGPMPLIDLALSAVDHVEVFIDGRQAEVPQDVEGARAWLVRHVPDCYDVAVGR